MNINEKVAIVAGSTGLTGSALIKEILSGAEFTKIKVITRRALALKDPRIEEILINDLREFQSTDPRFKADVYFCCLGTTIKKAGSQEDFRKVDFEGVKSFGEIAKANGAQAFILISAMGANPHSLIFYNRVKGEAETAIRKLEIPHTVIFRPSLLLGDRAEQRFAEGLSIKVVQSLSNWVPAGIQKKLGTKVKILVQRMVQEASTSSKGFEIIESAQI